MPDMGILTTGPVADDFSGTRLAACNLCEAICGLELTLEKGRVTDEIAAGVKAIIQARLIAPSRTSPRAPCRSCRG